ncbi:type II toxin-antitoxin system PemI/MazE family antitoxin [Isobaculum melis]|uniref:AbrB family transcriptional regulator n=1 Tax=Isobaculum melis TaxID=142588 RepID=A0A1H9SP18_9LACT|nr:AbrB family transcriptional regulator [Isobaculum melis]SER86644.1 hypothetical protein SAMN04488559_10861 [Isobaculum melis]
MDTVRARKQGNSIMVTLSSKLEVKEGQEFFYYKDKEGVISLIPKVLDYFEKAEKGEFVDEEDDLIADFYPVKSELDD